MQYCFAEHILLSVEYLLVGCFFRGLFGLSSLVTLVNEKEKNRENRQIVVLTKDVLPLFFSRSNDGTPPYETSDPAVSCTESALYIIPKFC